MVALVPAEHLDSVQAIFRQVEWTHVKVFHQPQDLPLFLKLGIPRNESLTVESILIEPFFVEEIALLLVADDLQLRILVFLSDLPGHAFSIVGFVD
jgi:hypothetical protein